MPARKTIACFSTLTIFAALTLALPQAVDAQTAKDLVCKGCVGKKDIGKKAVTSRHIKNGSVKGKDLKDGTVGADDLASGAVTTDKLADGSVTAEKLTDTARPTGVDFASDTGSTTLTTTTTSMLSTTLTAPVAGYAVVTANWYFQSNLDGSSAYCYLETTAGFGTGSYNTYWGNGSGGGTRAAPGSYSRVFEVPAGDTTFHLNCRAPTGTADLFHPIIHALFVPARY